MVNFSLATAKFYNIDKWGEHMVSQTLMFSHKEHMHRKRRQRCVASQVCEGRGSQNPSELQQHEHRNKKMRKGPQCRLSTSLADWTADTSATALQQQHGRQKTALINRNLPKWMGTVAFSATAEILNTQQKKTNSYRGKAHWMWWCSDKRRNAVRFCDRFIRNAR